MKVRTEITLPSGGVVMLRPPSMLDVMEVGDPPASLQRRARTKEKSPLTDAELAYHLRSTRAVLLHCTGLIRWKDHSARIVDKPFDECRDGEITVEDLSDDDARAILEAVGSLRQETAEAVQTFPEAQSPDAGNPRRNGETLPVPSDIPAEAVGG